MIKKKSQKFKQAFGHRAGDLRQIQQRIDIFSLKHQLKMKMRA